MNVVVQLDQDLQEIGVKLELLIYQTYAFAVSIHMIDF